MRILQFIKDCIICFRYFPIYLHMLIDKIQGKRIITYQLSSTGQLQYILPLHEALVKTQFPFSFYVSMDYPMVDKLIPLCAKRSHFFPARIAKMMFLIDVFLCTEIHSRGPKVAKRIFSGHGHANKLSHWAKENLKSFDYYFLHSPLERKMFEIVQAQQPQATSHIQLLNIGYPKIDDLVNRKFNRLKILERLSLDPNLKTVIYAPAWDPGGSLRTFGIKIAEILLSIPNINVIVKLHPASMEPPHSPYFEFYTGGKCWEEAFDYLNKHPRFKFIKDYSINPYLYVSDLMVNDFSGVALEYMSLHRPIIYIDCPEYYEKTLPEWGCDGNLARHDERFNAGRNAGTVVHHLDELKQTIERELADPNLHLQKRLNYSQKIMYNPGKGAEVGANEILKLLHQKQK